MEKRKNYTKEFKLDCVKHVQNSDKSKSEIARNLGIGTSTLCKWVNEFNDDFKTFPGKGNPRDEEVFRLKKELREVKEERDILKKAMAIFSKEQI